MGSSAIAFEKLTIDRCYLDPNEAALTALDVWVVLVVLPIVAV